MRREIACPRFFRIWVRGTGLEMSFISLLLYLLLSLSQGTDRTLVFVETKRNADFLATYLSQAGFPTTSIHGYFQPSIVTN